ncbi:hypothetical protein P3S67_017111 [Capsicum chacoense]
MVVTAYWMSVFGLLSIAYWILMSLGLSASFEAVGEEIREEFMQGLIKDCRKRRLILINYGQG